jgi:hypothetical protein
MVELGRHACLRSMYRKVWEFSARGGSSRVSLTIEKQRHVPQAGMGEQFCNINAAMVELGRHACLRSMYRKVWEFESPSRHAKM